ncbi:peroxiredoxin Q, chloroplastic-like [Phoenix dactylifera]|uniref:thioredoxin-dependent peroxiredoxin n=1 Tax=Phoenix dactylifera TaxID=42345 RepID=A0A8B7CP76_PHODC|nr:peroxiredoxin Q, chloroplastic-like [Phoenix dactylifera]
MASCTSLPKHPLPLVRPTMSKNPASQIISFLSKSSNSQFYGLSLPNLATSSSPRPLSPRTPIHAKVSKGDVPPPFTLKDQNGRNVSLTRFKGKPAVVYFYPADETPGCTKEACAFRDSYEKFKKAGAEVVGISGDDPASHKAFATKYGLPFTLLSDEGNKVRKEWGVPSDLFGVLPGRQTYVIDRKGAVQLVYNNQFQPEKHVEETLKLLQSL